MKTSRSRYHVGLSPSSFPSWSVVVSMLAILLAATTTKNGILIFPPGATAWAAPRRTTAAASLHPGLRHRRSNSMIRTSSTSTTTDPSFNRRINNSFRSHLTEVTMLPRGGGQLLEVPKIIIQTPTQWFNASVAAVALITLLLRSSTRNQVASSNDKKSNVKPPSVTSLQKRFLLVFWLLRAADWLQGPYFYQVYSSKMMNGQALSLAWVSRLFLTGFASTALMGPLMGRATDQYGRKKATQAFTVLYALAALTTKSNLLAVLFLGRTLSGIGTCLLFSAPEAWLVGEAQSGEESEEKQKYLGDTFGLAYAGDSIVAILAGQLASLAATQRGPTGPFELSASVLVIAGIITSFLWKENKAPSVDNEKPSIGEAFQVVRKDPKIMLVGGVQSLFEAAMYIFVLQWPVAISSAVKNAFGTGSATPYGTVFSSFMASCLLGSTIFSRLGRANVPTETSTASMLTAACLAMTTATLCVSQSNVPLSALALSFFVFEACVGMYFPSIGTLRSKYIPDSHRSVIMNIFGIPLNVLVVSVFLSIGKLGVKGALSVSSVALGIAATCMYALRRQVTSEGSASPAIAA